MKSHCSWKLELYSNWNWRGKDSEIERKETSLLNIKGVGNLVLDFLLYFSSAVILGKPLFFGKLTSIKLDKGSPFLFANQNKGISI